MEEDSNTDCGTTPEFGVSCADGLGDPSVYSSNAGFSSGTTYLVQSNPGAGFTVNCSPSATGSLGSDGSCVSASVSYKATASPAVISLTGGIGTSYEKHLLIGQQLTATLSTGPLSPSSWNWTASGGNPFKNWTASNDSAVYTPLGSETGSTLVCHFAKPDTATVSCTAHLPVPAGAQPAAGLDVTTTQTLTIEKPGATYQVDIGSPRDLPSSVNPSEVQLQRIFYPNFSPQAKGISWEQNRVTTPFDYVDAYNDLGSWNWTQLVTPGRQRKNNGVYEQLARTSVTPPQIVNGVQCLDGSYPYGGFWYPADGSQQGNTDSPSEPLEGGSSIRAKDVLDSFADYLMYEPPGSGSLPVPLKQFGWYWEFHATKDTGDYWNDSGQNANTSPLGDFPAFPVWSFPLEAQQDDYVAP